ncbi:hypothetical protein IZU99_08480 [Oscillospiraceae bacterium CM]|nr:hypothetical protein IZU99_08480 [Oscillospiraceae bacterium CM]
MEVVAIIISSIALIVSIIVAMLQIIAYSQEWRPVLSFVNVDTFVQDNPSAGIATIDYNINFTNSGKSQIQYEMKEFEIFWNDIQQSNVAEKSKGSVVGVGQKNAFNRHYTFGYTNISTLSTQSLTNSQPPEFNLIIPKTKIIFKLEYHKIGQPKKKYYLDYELFIEYNNNYTRMLLGKSIAT